MFATFNYSDENVSVCETHKMKNISDFCENCLFTFCCKIWCFLCGSLYPCRHRWKDNDKTKWNFISCFFLVDYYISTTTHTNTTFVMNFFFLFCVTLWIMFVIQVFIVFLYFCVCVCYYYTFSSPSCKWCARYAYNFLCVKVSFFLLEAPKCRQKSVILCDFMRKLNVKRVCLIVFVCVFVCVFI